jgi:thioredoxin 1
MHRVLTVLCLLGAALLTGGCGRPAGGGGTDDGGAAKASALPALTDASFDAAVAEGVVLVDFWAPRCPPCRAQLPLVEQAAEQLAGKATVAKLNVDEGQKTASRFGVSSIPTLIVFKDGREVKKFVGLTQSDDLVAAVNAALQ